MVSVGFNVGGGYNECVGHSDIQCNHVCKFYYHAQLHRFGRTAPFFSKRCNYSKQEGLSKRIRPDLLIKCIKSAHTGDVWWQGLVVLILVVVEEM